MGKRGRFLKSRKALSTIALIEAAQALVAILVLSGTLLYVDNELEITGFAKRVYKIDAGLLMTTFPAAEGSIFYQYYIKEIGAGKPGKNKFSFLISNNTVSVNATESPMPSFYWYFSDAYTLPISIEIINRTGMVSFIKEGNRVAGGVGISPNKNIITCPAVDTLQENWKSAVTVIIDPAHGEPNSNKGDLALRIAEDSAFAAIGNRKLTREDNVQRRLATAEQRADFIRKNLASDSIIVSINIGESPSTGKNIIKAYYNADSDKTTKTKSRKLGCTILNTIMKTGKLKAVARINGAAAIPLQSGYAEKILPAGNIGVILELGNMNFPMADNFLSDPTQIAVAIRRGMESYYTK